MEKISEEIKDFFLKNTWEEYFKNAELIFPQQWEEIIWPLIKDFDFSCVLEIGCGKGRCLEKFIKLSELLYGIDIDANLLDFCKKRFEHVNNVKLQLVNGDSLDFLENNTISFGFSFDTAVYLDKFIIASYIKELARVLKPKGKVFLHHSNLGDSAKEDIRLNINWRSNVSGTFIEKCLQENDLDMLQQVEIACNPIKDIITIFQKR